MKSLLLISGGLDSSSAAYYYKDKNYDCLYINYGQKSASIQYKYTNLTCKNLNKRLIYINIRNLGKAFYPDHWLKPHEPINHRNIILLSIAITFAKEKGYDEIIFSTVSDECIYETNKPEILTELKKLAEILGVKISMPFLNLSKSMVLKLGVSKGLDPVNTYSCLLGGKYHCGKCRQCELRKLAFKEAKLNDPTRYLY